MLTEKAILDATLNLLNTAKANDQIDLAMFYLSERQIINALKMHGSVHKFRILLDPNKVRLVVKRIESEPSSCV